MAENKYGKYISNQVIGQTPHLEVGTPIVILNGLKTWSEANLSFRISTIAQPFVMESKPHVHDYDAFMCFIGGNPLNFAEFEAEVELSLGEELEVQHITTTTIVYVPRGLYHCPLVYKRVTKPILFLHIFPESEYERRSVPPAGDIQ